MNILSPSFGLGIRDCSAIVLLSIYIPNIIIPPIPIPPSPMARIPVSLWSPPMKIPDIDLILSMRNLGINRAENRIKDAERGISSKNRKWRK